MSGQLIIDTLNTATPASGAGSVFTSSNAINGVFKAWVNFQGGGNGSYTNTAGVINSSFNVSSVTVNSTADYSINFKTSMSDTNYVAAGFSNYDPVISGQGRYMSLANAYTSNIRVWANYNYNALEQAYTCMVMVVGNG